MYQITTYQLQMRVEMAIEKFGDNPMFDLGLIIFSIFIFLLIGLFLIMKLKTSIDKNGIQMIFFPFRTESIMEELNGSLYIKTLLISFDVLPKHKGKYTIAPSEFIYLISKSNSDYFGNFTPTGEGIYKVNIPKNKIHIKSNELSFIVK